MPSPDTEPLGLLLARTARSVSRAFDEALAAAGGSRPMWLILLALKQRRWETQAELARAVGITGPTLTHHLDKMVQRDLVTRQRDPDNRRVQVIEMTPPGDDVFHRLRAAAVRHDRRLHEGFDDNEIRQLRSLLARLSVAVDADAQAGAADDSVVT
jgi:MarR family transcriptional regulator for hemolysin